MKRDEEILNGNSYAAEKINLYFLIRDKIKRFNLT